MARSDPIDPHDDVLVVCRPMQRRLHHFAALDLPWLSSVERDGRVRGVYLLYAGSEDLSILVDVHFELLGLHRRERLACLLAPCRAPLTVEYGDPYRPYGVLLPERARKALHGVPVHTRLGEEEEREWLERVELHDRPLDVHFRTPDIRDDHGLELELRVLADKVVGCIVNAGRAVRGER